MAAEPRVLIVEVRSVCCWGEAHSWRGRVMICRTALWQSSGGLPPHAGCSSKGADCFAAVWILTERSVQSGSPPVAVQSGGAVPWRRQRDTARSALIVWKAQFSVGSYNGWECACVLWTDMEDFWILALLQLPSSWNNLRFNRTVTKKNLKNSHI